MATEWSLTVTTGSSATLTRATSVWTSSVTRLAASGSRVRLLEPTDPERAAVRATVVIPCYRYGHFLEAAVSSALDQPGVNVDVIIVDDASPDGSGDRAEEIAGRNPAVSVIRHPRNAGHIATFNDGLAAASGDYVVVLSADDLLAPGSISRATSLMEAHPNVGLVYGRTPRFTGQPPLPTRTGAESWLVWAGRHWLAQRCRAGRNCIFSPEAIMRTSVLRQIGGYDPILPHTSDLAMWLQAATLADVGYVLGPEAAFYREHGQNMHSSTFEGNRGSGMVIDLRERRRTFDEVLAWADHRAPLPPDLREQAHRALATEALDLANRAYFWGVPDGWPVSELVDFAVETWPEIRRSPRWRLFSVKHSLGPRWSRHNPLCLPQNVMVRAQNQIREWRWERVGL